METKFRMNLIVGKFEPQNVDNSIRMQNAQQNIRPSLIVTLKIHDLNEESIFVFDVISSHATITAPCVKPPTKHCSRLGFWCHLISSKQTSEYNQKTVRTSFSPFSSPHLSGDLRIFNLSEGFPTHHDKPPRNMTNSFSVVREDFFWCYWALVVLGVDFDIGEIKWQGMFVMKSSATYEMFFLKFMDGQAWTCDVIHTLVSVFSTRSMRSTRSQSNKQPPFGSIRTFQLKVILHIISKGLQDDPSGPSDRRSTSSLHLEAYKHSNWRWYYT